MSKQYDGKATKEYWRKVKAGEIERPVNHGIRGKDKTPRASKMRMEIAARLKDAYNFDIHEEIIKNKQANDEIAAIAHEAKKNEDLELALDALSKYSTQQNKFVATVLPYVEGKKTARTTEDQEKTISIDDLYTQSIEDKS